MAAQAREAIVCVGPFPPRACGHPREAGWRGIVLREIDNYPWNNGIT